MMLTLPAKVIVTALLNIASGGPTFMYFFLGPYIRITTILRILLAVIWVWSVYYLYQLGKRAAAEDSGGATSKPRTTVCENCGATDKGLFVIEESTPREMTLCKSCYMTYQQDPQKFFTERWPDYQ